MRLCSFQIPKAVKIVEENYDFQTGFRASQEMMASFSSSVPCPVYLSAMHNNILVGIAAVSESFFNTHIYEIFWVNVLKSMQCKGVGRALIKSIIEHAWSQPNAKTIMLTANDDNEHFYNKFGFESKVRLGRTNLMIIER
jgi:GNAT superfamily N-acetyltransferase